MDQRGCTAKILERDPPVVAHRSASDLFTTGMITNRAALVLSKTHRPGLRIVIGEMMTTK